jgi:hypothetical protein
MRAIGLAALLTTLGTQASNRIGTDYLLVTPSEVQNKSQQLTLSRKHYKDKLQGFWLGQCIANWTGLVTEMDKIGDTEEFKTGAFYTRTDWGKPDLPSIWDEGKPSKLSPTIDFVFRDKNEVWGADDDTDIEYMYQYLMIQNETSILSAEQIRKGWLHHIKREEENYLWVSNQKAYDLMREGVLPPKTSSPSLNPHTEMIDAQLTTEIFGLFAPGHPTAALEMAKLPISVTARENAQWISEFYVVMYSLASVVDQNLNIAEQTKWLAKQARARLPDSSYSAKMYDYVLKQYRSGVPWEYARDSVYQRYQVEQKDGYDIPSKKLYCDGCFAAGINFAASIVSLLYGEGDLKETIKIGSLAGWDSDNPTATWGGLLGFMLGKQGVEKAFGRTFSDKFDIHRTRINFPNGGIDSFANMSQQGIKIIDRVVTTQLGGVIDSRSDNWIIPHGD